MNKLLVIRILIAAISGGFTFGLAIGVLLFTGWSIPIIFAQLSGLGLIMWAIKFSFWCPPEYDKWLRGR